jgi:hypothetical protein
VNLKDEGSAYSISFMEPDVPLSHTVIEVSEDYVVPRHNDRGYAVCLDARVTQLDDRPRYQTGLSIGHDAFLEAVQVAVFDSDAIAAHVSTIPELETDPRRIVGVGVANAALSNGDIQGIRDQNAVLEAADVNTLDSKRAMRALICTNRPTIGAAAGRQRQLGNSEKSGSASKVMPSPVFRV